MSEDSRKVDQVAGACGGADGACLPSVIVPEVKNKQRNLKLMAVAAALILVLALILFSGGGSDGGLFSLIPAEAASVEALDVSPGTFKYLAALPLWAQPENAESSLRAGVLAKMLPGYTDRDDYNALAALIKRLAVAVVGGEKLYIIESGNPWQIERIYSTSFSAAAAGKVEVERIQKVYELRLSGETYYMVKIASRVAMSKSKELIARVIRCYRGDDGSLGGVGLSWENDSDRRVFFCGYRVPVVLDTDALRELGFSTGAYRKDAAEFTEVVLNPEGVQGVGTFTRIINDSHIVAAAGGGFFSFIGSVLLITLAVVIGLPMGFLAIVMLTAVYFYLVALIKGELVPVSPPELPELSKEMVEDLSRKAAPVDKSAKSAGVAGQDEPEE